MVIPFDPCIP